MTDVQWPIRVVLAGEIRSDIEAPQWLVAWLHGTVVSARILGDEEKVLFSSIAHAG
jgi:hypothetical protein